MSFALIVKDGVPVAVIRELLTREGAAPLSVVRLHEILNEEKSVGQAELIFVVSTAQDFLSAGEAVSQTRRRLGDGQKLVLCMPCPYKDQRLRLLGLGADEIISPAGSAAEQVCERILGHLILHGLVTPSDYGQMLGATSRMREVYGLIGKYARLELSVLLRGETGTGKGLAAGELHRESGRGGAFVHFNCTAFNPGTFEDELFGHVKGAFSGAHTNRKGLIEEAQDGTVFIDEIGDFDLALQAKLLDVVENKRVRPLGFNKYRDVDVRFIFATNRDLEALAREGKFRDDLVARMDVLSVTLPPLRQRKADIPLLVRHFVAGFNEKHKTNVFVEGGAVDELFRHDWRLNVRGLSSVVFKAAAVAGADGAITNFMLSEAGRQSAGQGTDGAGQAPPGDVIEINPRALSWRALQDRTEEAYFRALAATSMNVEHAMELSKLGKSRLFEVLKKYDLHIGGKPPRSSGDGEDARDGEDADPPA